MQVGLMTTDAAHPAEELWRREHTSMVRLAYLVCGNESAAEDVVQEAFADVVRRWDAIDRPGAYLRTAVVSLSRRAVRSEQRHQRRARRLSVVRDAHEPVAAVDEPLFDAISRLNERQRVIVICRFWAGWTEAEIATALGCRPGTVKSACARALAQLRKEIER
jgi:RNA polymerase sigma factor (sigma-70 family)